MGEGSPQKVSLHHLFTANVYDGGCKRLRERMQTFAVKRGSALQGRMQCTASETGKTDTEIASPILDKRKGRKDAPISPRKFLPSPDFGR